MSKGKLPYFCWYPADFEVDENVKLMNIEEIGLYAICLNHCWLNGSLPSDPLEIARAMKVPKGQFLRAWPRVAPCFTAREDGRWTNPRQERERVEANARTDHGRKGAAGNVNVQRPNPKVVAYANLFASAPELLAALKIQQEELQRIQGYVANRNNEAAMDVIGIAKVAAARAIAKAEGR